MRVRWQGDGMGMADRDAQKEHLQAIMQFDGDIPQVMVHYVLYNAFVCARLFECLCS